MWFYGWLTSYIQLPMDEASLEKQVAVANGLERSVTNEASLERQAMDEASLEIVDAGEMYPKQALTTDDGGVSVPFSLLSGENPLFMGHSIDGAIVITNYRFYQSEGPFINIPLGLIDYIECKEILFIWIYCKDARTYRCTFENSDETQKWLKRIQTCIKLPDKIDHCFAFRFLSWTREEHKDDAISQTLCQLGALHDSKDQLPDNTLKEAKRMGFDVDKRWKISKINDQYKVCPSYPRNIIIPAEMEDSEMQDLANFRYSKRIPAVVWRYRRNGCVIARSSQPRMGILGWRNAHDEKLIAKIFACSTNKVYASKTKESDVRKEGDTDMSIFCGEDSDKEKKDETIENRKKLLIIDARSYTAAVTNRAKGGGYECNEYYPDCEIHFMGLANIHTIRNSFNSLRTLCSLSDDQNWLSTLENTRWLHHISGLLRSALVVVDAIDVDERPVLVHCSDGWDRTPQIVALAEIMLDPYYRTKKGFQVLVEREWLEYGHKFADRCGNPDGTDDRNERSPVFLQWLDCIYQLLKQFPCHFEFNEQYLARLVLHTYSCLFGTFLCNTDEKRNTFSVRLRTFSVWPVLNEKCQFHNYLYNNSTEVLRPSCQIRCLKFWSDIYVPNSLIGLGRPSIPPTEEPSLVEGVSEKTHLVKTKSCDDIHTTGDDIHITEHPLILHRRNSDPNLIENTFIESVTCPQLIHFSEEMIHDPVIVETVPFNDLEEVDDLLSSDRTENQISISAPLNSNFVAREPAIDGSTDTLVSECGALIQEQCENNSQLGNAIMTSEPVCSVGTDTADLPVTLEDVLQSVTQQANYMEQRFPLWCQNVIDTCTGGKRTDHSNSFSCSYATPNHSRTPSSGFPATPCDDAGDLPNLKKDSSTCQVMDFDGLDIIPDYVQDRIEKLILHYKNKVGNLNSQLADVRSELFQHIYRYQGKENRCRLDEDAPSLADSASSGDHQVESEGSESSWDYLHSSPDHGTAGLGV
ncbi:myotubularin-related protein 3 [Trichonephila inaurata madagascariensis]|uniref:Myotubularin-related protein 3 n=1 Tax=Trichonephila inaurata madagascariensis TaxID=2747483 RepID=A0A8X6WLP0_9ARAC|nr:myotubularin-related protein 3 [Trichonephila inaurata madagascariensis]